MAEDVLDHLFRLDVSRQQLIEMVDQLRWQDPSRAASVLLALVDDVNIEGEERLAVIRAALRLGPAAHRAACWLLTRSDFAYLEGETLFAAQELVGTLPPGASWCDAYALVASSVDVDDEARADAAATLVNEAPLPAAYLAVKEWFSPDDLPRLADNARERGVLGAAILLAEIVRDESLPQRIRIDAAEDLSQDNDSPDSGISYLLELMADPSQDPEIRRRALLWLDDPGSRQWDSLDRAIRKSLGLPETDHPGEVVTGLMAAYRRELRLAGATSTSTH